MRKLFRIVLIVFLIIIMIISGAILYRELSSLKKEYDTVNYIDNIIKETLKTEKEIFNKESFDKLKAENDEFVGYLSFDSGIIRRAIAKGVDNEYYLWRDFNKRWIGNTGNPFMNVHCSIDDPNITIYGHNHEHNPKAMFSPLNDMVDQDFYEKNSTFKFYTEDSIREYAICYVYYITIDEYVDYNFSSANLNDMSYDEFFELPTRKNLIKSIHGDIEDGNKFITLQTCKRWNSDIKVIVVAKEVMRSEYE